MSRREPSAPPVSPGSFFGAIQPISGPGAACGDNRRRRRRPSPANGDCDFAADPTKAAHETPVLWLSQLDPRLVVLTPDPTGSATLVLGQVSTAFDRTAPDGRHLVLGGLQDAPRAFSHALLAPGTPPDAPLAATLPLDLDLPLRVDALLQLWRGLAGRAPRASPDSLTRLQRQRLVLMLRAVDGRGAKATRRQIAEALFGAAAIPAGGAFSDHHLRSRTARLIRDGLTMCAGGYLRLLRT